MSTQKKPKATRRWTYRLLRRERMVSGTFVYEHGGDLWRRETVLDCSDRTPHAYAVTESWENGKWVRCKGGDFWLHVPSLLACVAKARKAGLMEEEP